MKRFRRSGAAPIEWLIRLRVRRAQDLLETTDAPIDHVADVAGFGAPETLRHHFRKVVGVSPSAWRSSFRGKRERAEWHDLTNAQSTALAEAWDSPADQVWDNL